MFNFSRKTFSMETNNNGFADPVCILQKRKKKKVSNFPLFSSIFSQTKQVIVQICSESDPYNSWKCFQIIRAQNIKKQLLKIKKEQKRFGREI